jgi:translation initiation factor IF-2
VRLAAHPPASGDRAQRNQCRAGSAPARFKQAQKREVEEAKRAEEEAKRRAEEEARLKKAAEEEAARLAEEANWLPKAEARKPKVKEKPVVEDEPVADRCGQAWRAEEDAPSRGRGGDSAQTRRNTHRSMAAMRRRQEKARRGQQQDRSAREGLREVTIPDAITIQELANRMAERAVDVIKC